MAAWFTVIKTIWPHLAPIVAAAVPVFTQRQSAGARDPDNLLQQQIDELQQASAQNTIYIKELAEQLRIAVAAWEQEAVASQAQLQRAQTLAWLAFGVAAIALGTAAYVLVTV